MSAPCRRLHLTSTVIVLLCLSASRSYGFLLPSANTFPLPKTLISSSLLQPKITQIRRPSPTLLPSSPTPSYEKQDTKTPTRRQILPFLILSPLPLLLTTTSTNAIPTLLPSPGDIPNAIPQTWDDDDDSPFSSPSIFNRLDNTPDDIFYSAPRFVEHVDDGAVQAMTNYIRTDALKDGDVVLDLCASHVSHIVPREKVARGWRVSGLGMNEEELRKNPVLDDYVVKDLNREARLPYDSGVFDVVLCQLSIDYLVKPLEVMREVGRVLKGGGKVVILFSNRLFIQKAVGLWTGADDVDHAYTVGAYLHYCNAGFENIQAIDLSTRKGRDKNIVGDPLYAVTATVVPRTEA